MKTEELLLRCDDFSLSIIDLYIKFEKTGAGRVIAKQILRSGTSVGANLEEAQGAESKADFSHKISICYKETRETGY